MATEHQAPPRRPSLSEPDKSVRLQVLASEHWSLLATRALTYSESFSRVGIFISVLSGAVIALALIAQAGKVGQTFLVAAILLLSVVGFLGVTTVTRLQALNRDDVRWVAGMNRIRQGYLDLDPGAEKYLMTSTRDDVRGVMLTMGIGLYPGNSRWSVLHVVQTLPGTMAVIAGVAIGALAAMVVSFAVGSATLAVVTGGLVFLVTAVILVNFGRRRFVRFSRALESRFPSGD